VGPAASGKDYVKNKLIEMGYISDVAFTTRPPRSNEINGKDYNFVSLDEFDNLDLFESVEFNGWKYGKSLESWNESDIFIMTPSGIRNLDKDKRKDSFVVLIEVSEEERLRRLKLRNDSSDSVERRIEADKKDFDGFRDYNFILYNNGFTDINMLVQKMLNFYIDMCEKF
jgi:guanylate kinase